MKWVFWFSLALIAYAYLGFPAWLLLRRFWRSNPVRQEPILPSVSVVIAVHNEAQNLVHKLRNLSGLDYPPDKLEVILVSDGSTDATNQVLAAWASERVRVEVLSDHRGKAAALNRGVEMARGEIVVFTDARQRIEFGALRRLVVNFADPSVGCVSGELMLGESDGQTSLEGVGLYWRLEKKIRQWEGETGSVVGATGAFYAVRRELVARLPEETILDDVYIPLHVVRQGRRVVFEPQARAWDPLVTSSRQEFRRKVRTLTGNYQLVQLAPWLLSRANRVRFEFVSHKLLRLFVPLALAGLLVSTALLPGSFYRALLLLQVAFYGLGVLAMLWPDNPAGRIGSTVVTFLVLNAAAVMAMFHFLTRKKEVWVR